MNLTFFKLSPSLFYVDIFQSLQNSSSGRDGGFKTEGKEHRRGMTSSPVRRREPEKDARGGMAHITPTKTHVYSRSLSQNIPQSKSLGHLPLGRLRIIACSKDS